MHRLLMSALFLSVVGCGDPLADGGYLGEPLLTISGNVLFTGDLGDAPEGQLRLSLFWGGPNNIGHHEVESAEQQVVTTTRLPAQYTMRLYEPPRDHLLTPLPETDARGVIGAVLLYVDADASLSWDPESEPIVGGTSERLILYTPTSLDDLSAGYHAVEADRECDGGEGLYATLEPADKRHVDLVVGVDADHLLIDLDCDDQLDEWCNTCPDEGNLEALCLNDPMLCSEAYAHCVACYIDGEE